VGDESRNEDRSPSGGELFFPEALLADERAAARIVLNRCPDQAQALLDELSARIQAGAVHTSPIAYLRGLVRRAMAGEFVPELGQRVAATRRRRGEELILRQQREVEEQRLAAERATPAYQANISARPEEIRRMLGAMPSRRQRGRRS